MRIEKFNPDNLRKLIAKIHAALSGVEKECGLSISIEGGSYQDHKVKFKLEAFLLDEDGTSKQDREDFLLYGLYAGFDEHDFGKIFTIKGRQFKIAGWNKSRREYPVIAISDKDVSWFFSPKVVLQALGKSGSIV